MRTTVTLDDDVFQAAKALAEATGKRLGEVLSALARRGMQTREELAKENGLPVFRVPTDAPIIPSTRARELLADEDA